MENMHRNSTVSKPELWGSNTIHNAILWTNVLPSPSLEIKTFLHELSRFIMNIFRDFLLTPNTSVSNRKCYQGCRCRNNWVLFTTALLSRVDPFKGDNVCNFFTKNFFCRTFHYTRVRRCCLQQWWVLLRVNLLVLSLADMHWGSAFLQECGLREPLKCRNIRAHHDFSEWKAIQKCIRIQTQPQQSR